MEYYTMIHNHECDTTRPLLSAMEADAEIARLHGVIQAQAGTIIELQTAIHEMAMQRTEK